MKQLLNFVATGAMIIACALFGALLILEMAVGCGEHYIDSSSVVHINQCVVLK